MVTLYIVDDEDMIREGLQYYLDWSSYGVKVVGSQINGERALPEILQTEPDAVLTDVVMPKMDGIELAKQLRLSGYTGEIIFLSAYQEMEYVRKALQLSAADFIFKPVQTGDMIAMIEKMVKKVKEKKSKGPTFQEAEKAIMDLRKLEEEKLWDSLLFHNEDLGSAFSERQTGILEEINHSFRRFCVLLFHSHSLPIEVIEIQLKCWKASLPAQAAFLFTCAGNNKTVCTIVAFRDIKAKESSSAEEILRHMTQQYRSSFHDSTIVEAGVLVENIYDIGNSYKSALRSLSMHFSLDDAALPQNFTASEKESADQWARILAKAAWSGENEKIESSVAGFLRSMLEDHITDINLIKANCIFACLSICDALYLSKEYEIFNEFNVEAIRIMDCICIDDLSDCLGNALKKLSKRLKEQSPRDRLVKKVKSVIAQNLETIDINGISRKINISRNYLASEFKRMTGETLNDYITRKRMEKAKQLLKAGEFRIYEIANRVGYKDTAYFSRLFKREVGCLPNEFRERTDKL